MKTEKFNAAELCKVANQYGFIETVHTVFGGSINISIPVGKETINADIAELSLSVRAYNGLRRSEIFKLGDLIEALQQNTLPCIRNLGRKSISEIKTKMLDYCYHKLSEKEKIMFFQDMINSN